MDAFKDGLIQFLFWLMIGSGGLVAYMAAKEIILAMLNRQSPMPKVDPAKMRDQNIRMRNAKPE